MSLTGSLCVLAILAITAAFFLPAIARIFVRVKNSSVTFDGSGKIRNRREDRLPSVWGFRFRAQIPTTFTHPSH